MGKGSPKKGAWKAEPLMAPARLEMQGINQGGGAETCEMLVPPSSQPMLHLLEE